MAINLKPSVNVSDLDLYRVQQRLEGPIQDLQTTPWGSGVEIDSVLVQSVAGTQSVTLTHNLGRSVSSALVLHSPIQVSPAWNVQSVNKNTCKFNISITPAPPAGTTLDFWIS